MKFWAVWRETGGVALSKRHDTKESAISEAGRLAWTTGERYFVLEVVGVSASTTLSVEYIDIDAV